MMSYLDRKRVYEHAIDRFGCRAQILMAVEEMSELTKEICKVFRPDCDGNNDRIAEECADVLITLEQLRMILGLDEAVAEQMDRKVRRLAEKLEVET